MQQEFIGYTVGLMARHEQYDQPLLVKAEYNRLPGGDVKVITASGQNLAQVKKAGTVTLSAEEYENRPADPYDDTREAMWALGLMGWEVGGNSDDEE